MRRQPEVPKFIIYPEKDKKMTKRKRISKTAVITILAEKNPKRNGTLAFARFALYKNGMTVKEYLEAGGRTGDLQYDIDNKHIEVKEPA